MAGVLAGVLLRIAVTTNSTPDTRSGRCGRPTSTGGSRRWEARILIGQILVEGPVDLGIRPGAYGCLWRYPHRW